MFKKKGTKFVSSCFLDSKLWYSKFDSDPLLNIAQIFAIVNMKHVTGIFDHYVIVVSVADAKYIGGNAISSTWFSEIDDCFAEIVRTWIMRFKPIVYTVLLFGWFFFSADSSFRLIFCMAVALRLIFSIVSTNSLTLFCSFNNYWEWSLKLV